MRTMFLFLGFIGFGLVMFFLVGDALVDRSWLDAFGRWVWLVAVGLLVLDIFAPIPTTLIITGSPSGSSRTARLAGVVGERLAALGVDSSLLDLRSLPAEDLLHARFEAPSIVSALERVAAAQGVVVATPVYKAAYSGVLKTFLDVLPQFGLRLQPGHLRTAFRGEQQRESGAAAETEQAGRRADLQPPVDRLVERHQHPLLDLRPVTRPTARPRSATRVRALRGRTGHLR